MMYKVAMRFKYPVNLTNKMASSPCLENEAHKAKVYMG